MPLAKVWSTHLDNNRQAHTGQASAVWSLAVSIPGVTQLFLQVCLQQLSPHGCLCNKHRGRGDGAKDAVEIAKSPQGYGGCAFLENGCKSGKSKMEGMMGINTETNNRF